MGKTDKEEESDQKRKDFQFRKLTGNLIYTAM